MRSEQLEGRVLTDGMALHQDPLGTLGDGAPPERALEVVVLGKTAQHDVDRALPFGRIVVFAIGDVGEDAALGGFADEARWYEREIERCGKS